MRTYILALTKYGIAALVVAYTILAFIMLFRRSRQAVHSMCVVQIELMAAMTVVSYVTLFTALGKAGYLLMCVLQVAVFSAAFFLYQTLYSNAYMPIFNNMCMLLSIGLIFLSRIGLDRAAKQFVIAVGGLAIAFILPFFRSKFYLLKKTGYVCAFLGIAALAVVMLLGSTTLGANITYTIFGLTFQPSEFVKILYLIFLAATLKDAKDLQDLIPIAVFAGAHVLVLIGSKDLGSGLIFYIVFIFMVYMATGKVLYLAGGFGAMAAASVVLYHFFSHIQQRVQAFLDPWSLIDSIGYQITQALFAISAGGVFGDGLGQGTPDKIPFVESDFVFAGLTEELGQIVGICVILITLSCFLHMLSLSMHFADRFYRLLAFGAAISYGFQAFLTLGGQTKFIPLTGVTLPMISYGGSSILSTILLFTMVQIMYMLRGDRIDEYKRKQRRLQRERASYYDDDGDRYGYDARRGRYQSGYSRAMRDETALDRQDPQSDYDRRREYAAVRGGSSLRRHSRED